MSSYLIIGESGVAEPDAYESDPARYLHEEIAEDNAICGSDSHDDEGDENDDENDGIFDAAVAASAQNKCKHSPRRVVIHDGDDNSTQPPSPVAEAAVEAAETPPSKEAAIIPAPPAAAAPSPPPPPRPHSATTPTTSAARAAAATAALNSIGKPLPKGTITSTAYSPALLSREYQNRHAAAATARLRELSASPSCRPLSATLRQIMADTPSRTVSKTLTKPEQEQEQFNLERREEERAGAKSVFTSHSPPAERIGPDGDLTKSYRATANLFPPQRIGFFFSDAAKLRHLPGGPRGAKSVLVPQPVSVYKLREEVAFALQIGDPRNVAVGSYERDGVTQRHIDDDEELVRYLHDQPRVVPFVQAFVLRCDVGETPPPPPPSTALSPRRPESAPTASRSLLGVGLSSPSPLPHQQQQQQQQQQTATEAERAADDSNTDSKETIRVVKSANSERGLDVLAPAPPTASVFSAWRLNVDSTMTPPPPLRPSSSASMTARSGSRLSQTSSSNAPTPIMYRPYRRLSSNEFAMGGLAAQLVQFDGTVSDAAINAVYTQLFDGALGGVAPTALLQHLDAHMDNFGDRRRFERALGAMMFRRCLSSAQVGLVLLKIARE